MIRLAIVSGRVKTKNGRIPDRIEMLRDKIKKTETDDVNFEEQDTPRRDRGAKERIRPMPLCYYNVCYLEYVVVIVTLCSIVCVLIWVSLGLIERPCMIGIVFCD